MTDGDGSENGGDPADAPAEEPDESEEHAVDQPEDTDDGEPGEGNGEDQPSANDGKDESDPANGGDGTDEPAEDDGNQNGGSKTDDGEDEPDPTDDGDRADESTDETSPADDHEEGDPEAPDVQDDEDDSSAEPDDSEDAERDDDEEERAEVGDATSAGDEPDEERSGDSEDQTDDEPSGEGDDDGETPGADQPDADATEGTVADSDAPTTGEESGTGGDGESGGQEPDDESTDTDGEDAADDESGSTRAFEDGLPTRKKSRRRKPEPSPVPGPGTDADEDDGDDADDEEGSDEPEAAAEPTGDEETQPYRGSVAETPTGRPAALEGDDEHAPDDEEMPLADHVEEMVRRLGVILVLMAGVSAVVFPFGEYIINVIWYSFLPGTYELCPTTSIIPRDPSAVITAAATDVGAGPGVTMAEGANIKPACPRVYQPLATIFARLKVATLAGFVVALPGFVYETYLFMRPGLYPRERRYYLAAVPTSLVLAAIGVAFAYLLVLPAIFTYFLYYSEGAAEIAFGLTESFDLMVLMMGFFAAIFQIPLFIMLAIMMGVTSREWLVERRLLFWAAFAGVAFIFNPDPTGMAPFIVAATMIVLFEGTLLLISWTGSEGILPAPEAVAARRPYAWLAAIAGGYLASDAPLPTGSYEALPGLLRGYIENNNLVGMTPLVVGGLLIAVYELMVFLLGRYLPLGTWKQRLFTGRVSLYRLRAPVWILSLLVGYFTSPNPFLLERARAVTLEPVESAAVAIGLIVAFEALLAAWRYFQPDPDERLPIEE